MIYSIQNGKTENQNGPMIVAKIMQRSTREPFPLTFKDISGISLKHFINSGLAILLIQSTCS